MPKAMNIVNFGSNGLSTDTEH